MMDCRTARTLLEFARPRSPELEEAELDYLHEHLATCPVCGPAAQAERRVDDRIGRAMRAVSPPEGLRKDLLERLRRQQYVARRRRVTWAGAGLVGLAAAVLLAVSVGKQVTRPAKVNPEEAGADLFGRVLNPSAETVEHWFRSRGVEMVAPPAFNYTNLRSYDFAYLQGRNVPFLRFVAHGSEAGVEVEAGVYVLSERDFDLADALANPATSGSGYVVTLQRHPSDPHVAYLIVSTASTLDAFLVPRSSA